MLSQPLRLFSEYPVSPWYNICSPDNTGVKFSSFLILYGIIYHDVLYMGWAGFLSSMEEHADSAKIYKV